MQEDEGEGDGDDDEGAVNDDLHISELDFRKELTHRKGENFSCEGGDVCGHLETDADADEDMMISPMMSTAVRLMYSIVFCLTNCLRSSFETAFSCGCCVPLYCQWIAKKRGSDEKKKICRNASHFLYKLK